MGLHKKLKSRHKSFEDNYHPRNDKVKTEDEVHQEKIKEARKSLKTNELLFMDLKDEECFRYDNCVYVKCHIGWGDGNAYCIFCGSGKDFEDYEIVTKESSLRPQLS